jgi:hypothetical protein
MGQMKDVFRKLHRAEDSEAQRVITQAIRVDTKFPGLIVNMKNTEGSAVASYIPGPNSVTLRNNMKNFEKWQSNAVLREDAIRRSWHTQDAAPPRRQSSQSLPELRHHPLELQRSQSNHVERPFQQRRAQSMNVSCTNSRHFTHGMLRQDTPDVFPSLRSMAPAPRIECNWRAQQLLLNRSPVGVPQETELQRYLEFHGRTLGRHDRGLGCSTRRSACRLREHCTRAITAMTGLSLDTPPHLA